MIKILLCGNCGGVFLGQGTGGPLGEQGAQEAFFSTGQVRDAEKIDLGFIFCRLGIKIAFSFDCGLCLLLSLCGALLSVFSASCPSPFFLLKFVSTVTRLLPSQTPPLCPGFLGEQWRQAEDRWGLVRCSELILVT